MKYRMALLFAGFSLLCTAARGEALQTLDQEMNRLGVDTVLIMPALDIEQYPLWSPQADYVAVNVMGTWQKIDLGQIALKPTVWRGNQKIGVINSSSISGATREEVSEWKRVSRVNATRVTTKAGTRFELRSNEFNTASLIITRKGEKGEVRWSADLERCHSLVLSPDERYVAFISETNGVVIMRADGR